MKSFENKSGTTEAAPSQQLEKSKAMALSGKQTLIESRSSKYAKAAQLQEIADAFTAKNGSNQLTPTRNATIQREIVGKDGQNIWANGIGPKLITEPNQVIVRAVRLLHDNDEKIPVADYDTLVQGILNGDYNIYLTPAIIGELQASNQDVDADDALVDEDDVVEDDAVSVPSISATAAPVSKSKGKPRKKSARAKKDEKRRAKGKGKSSSPPVKIGDDSWVPVDVGNNKVSGLKNLTDEQESGLLKSAPKKLGDDSASELLLRGDTRSPNELLASDGFKSYLRSDAIDALKEEGVEITEESITAKEQELMQDKQGHDSPMEHMVPAANSGVSSSFMSFSRALEPGIEAVVVAGESAPANTTQGYIYAVLAEEALPIKDDTLVQAAVKYEELADDEEAQKVLLRNFPQLNAYVGRDNFESYNQAEYLVRNQVDWAHVVAYQEVRNGLPFGPVFMRSAIQEDPMSRAKVSSVFESTPKKLDE